MAYLKPMNTLSQLLERPNNKILKERVVGPVYHIPCGSCDASYIGETEKSLKTRFLEDRRPSSTTSEVSQQINTDNPEPPDDPHQDGAPSLNKDGSRHNLPSIWKKMLRSRA